MLAEPFTSETAKQNQLKSAQVRKANKALALIANQPELPIARTRKQINRVLHWMERTSDKDEYFKLSTILDRLWSKAYPVQGTTKPNRNNRQSTPQPIVSCMPESAPSVNITSPVQEQQNIGSI